MNLENYLAEVVTKSSGSFYRETVHMEKNFPAIVTSLIKRPRPFDFSLPSIFVKINVGHVERYVSFRWRIGRFGVSGNDIGRRPINAEVSLYVRISTTGHAGRKSGLGQGSRRKYPDFCMPEFAE